MFDVLNRCNRVLHWRVKEHAAAADLKKHYDSLIYTPRVKTSYEVMWSSLIGMMDNWAGVVPDDCKRQYQCDWCKPRQRLSGDHCTSRTMCLFCRLFLRDMPWWDGIVEAYDRLESWLPAAPMVKYLTTITPVIHSIPRTDVRPYTGIAPWHLKYLERQAKPYLEYLKTFVKNYYGRLSPEKQQDTFYAWYVQPRMCYCVPYRSYRWQQDCESLDKQMLESMLPKEAAVFEEQHEVWREKKSRYAELDWETYICCPWFNVRLELRLIELSRQSRTFEFADKAVKNLHRKWEKLTCCREVPVTTDIPVLSSKSTNKSALSRALKQFFKADMTWVAYPNPWFDLQRLFPSSASGNIKIGS